MERHAGARERELEDSHKRKVRDKGSRVDEREWRGKDDASAPGTFCRYLRDLSFVSCRRCLSWRLPCGKLRRKPGKPSLLIPLLPSAAEDLVPPWLASDLKKRAEAAEETIRQQAEAHRRQLKDTQSAANRQLREAQEQCKALDQRSPSHILRALLGLRALFGSGIRFPAQP